LGDDSPASGTLLHALRQLHYNPQRFVDRSDPRAAVLVDEKVALLAMNRPAERAQRRQRYLRLREINAQLAPFVAPRRAELTARLRELEHTREAQRVLHNREFSWVLYPAETLRAFYAATFA
jgi:hypothetical protein